MKRVLADAALRKRITQKGQETIRTVYSPRAIGDKMRNRLQALGLL
ncbi:hypothetical protein BpJC7_02130 [Weizmannia acidilactici]|uniref:Uncharacterized protein n=1 Tax=Weizmannia acidilactici TaxID=2607726 RepID=A0A5J4JEN6_9BACI|nr:hypothetical protein [Weizmannia acidilactici]GER68910.1 hypothetical protein BpJC7_02130 [Weizmannia acidilactici]